MPLSSGATANSSSSADRVAATTAMCVMSAVTIASNLAVLIVVIQSPALRTRLTNFFVVNLCIIDSLAATIVMPLMLVNLTGISPHLSTPNVTVVYFADAGSSMSCSAVRLLTAVVVFASVLSVLLVNVERFVSIRYPMQHAAHLTVSRTLAALACVWILAFIVAAVPIVADWDVLDTGTRCCGKSPTTLAVVYVIVVETLLFVAPTFLIAIMYCSIYRVARQAGRQVAPGVGDRNHISTGRPPPKLCHRPASSINAAAGCSLVNSSSMSCPALNHTRRHTDMTMMPPVISEPTLFGENNEHGLLATSALSPIGDAPECIIRTSLHEDGASTAAVTAQIQDANGAMMPDNRWKAAVTLVLVLLTFMPLWSPFFAYTLHRAVGRSPGSHVLVCNQAASADNVEIAVVWIAFATFASNAFVYGCMNRAIRNAFIEAVDSALSRCSWAPRNRDRLSQVFGAGDAEDFLQFLERTSSVDRAQSLTQSSSASVQLTKVSQTRGS